MKRLYLTDRDRYRVQLVNGRTLIARWEEDRLQFHNGKRGVQGRYLRMDTVSGVAPYAGTDWVPNADVTYLPLDQCFLARHRPPDEKRTAVWVHPIRARAGV